MGALLALVAMTNVSRSVSLQAQTPAPDPSAANDGQQPGHYSDRELTAKIRQSLVRDKMLSVYGHSITITSQNGTVTLEGTVHSVEDRQAIASRAASFAGQGKINNNLTVAP